MRGSLVVTPEQQIDGSERVTVAGRPISIYHYGWGSTPGDLVVLDCQTRVVFAGGLVSIGRVPDLRDGDFEGWLTTLDALEKLPAAIDLMARKEKVILDAAKKSGFGIAALKEAFAASDQIK